LTFSSGERPRALWALLYINVKLRKVYGYIKQIMVRISPQAREHMAMYVVKSIYIQIYDQVYGSINANW